VGHSALHYAARLGHKDVVKFLIATAPAAILEMVDTDKGHSALHLAAANGRRTICCILVAAGANIALKDKQGLTATDLAKKSEDVQLHQYLESQMHFMMNGLPEPGSQNNEESNYQS